MDHFGTPRRAMGSTLVCLKTCIRLLTSWDVQFRANRFKVCSLLRKRGLAEFIPGSQQSLQPPQCGASAAAPNPTSLVPDARMTRLQDKLPQHFSSSRNRVPHTKLELRRGSHLSSIVIAFEIQDCLFWVTCLDLPWLSQFAVV